MSAAFLTPGNVGRGMAENTTKTRLDSWKEIAAYLGRDVRTAIRWEKDKSLPVHRVPGGKHHSVFAYPEEIDAWLNQQPAAPVAMPVEENLRGLSGSWAHQRKGWIAGLGIALALAGVLGAVHFTGRLSPVQVERITFRGNKVVAWDARGEPAWSHRLESSLDISEPGSPGYLFRLSRVVDLDGDGRNEALVVARTRTGPNPTDPFRARLICFSPRGKVLWEYEATEVLTFGGLEYKAPWDIYDVLVVPASPRPRIWVAFVHNFWFAAYVAQVDPTTGAGRVQFVNSGTLFALGYLNNEQGSWLLAGGFNSEYEVGTLAVLDAKQEFAASPQTPGSRYHCDSCPEGSPERYFLFPRSELNLLTKKPLNQVYEIGIREESIKVSTEELSPAARAIYEFPHDLDPDRLQVVFTSPYWMEHETLEREGKIDHTAQQCPDRMPLRMRIWSREDGWAETHPLQWAPGSGLPTEAQLR